MLVKTELGIRNTYWLRELVTRVLLLFRWESTEGCRLQNSHIFGLVKNANTRQMKGLGVTLARLARGNSHQLAGNHAVLQSKTDARVSSIELTR